MISVTDLIGVPFVGGGRDPKTGLDCYGLVSEVYRREGIIIPEYNQRWDDRDACMGFYNKEKDVGWERVNIKDVTAPCLIAISFGVKFGIVNHSGVYIGGGRFIHTREKTGVCIEKIDSPAWARTIVGFYRWKNDNTCNNKKSV